jgi:hypothetical protein
VLRGDSVYLAQIGPAKALLVTPDGATGFPERSEDQLPLGVSSGLDIKFAHNNLRAGDCLLLTGESWTVTMPEQALAAALAADGAEVGEVIRTLEHRVGSGSFSALIMQCALPAEATVPTLVAEQLPLFPAERADALDWAGREPRAPLIEPEPATYVDLESAPEVEAERTDVTGPVSVEAASLELHDEPPREEETPWHPSKPLVGFALDGARLDRSRKGLQQFGTTLIDALRALLMRVLPEPELSPSRHRRRRVGITENVPMMAGIAVAIPLVVAFVVVTFYLQRSAAEQQEALVNETLRAVETARQADGQDAPVLWGAALETAEEALQTAPQDEEILALRAEARGWLDQFGRVLRPEFVSLWDYGSSGDRRLVASRMQLFVLDAREDQVNQHPLNQARSRVTGEQLSLVAYRGQSVGDEEIGELRDLVWLSGGSSQAGDVLLVLTADNHLLRHSLSWGLSWVPFDSQLTPDNVTAMSPYDGKLYVLDALQNQIWRFPSSGDGFGPAEHYFAVPSPDISNAIDMTIDGAVYVLLANGQIYKFFGGESQPYQITGLPEPLQRPKALVSEGDATSGALYVVDAGAQSIVALTKAGEFIFQIKGDDDALSGLEDLAIEEESRTLFVLANGYLFSVALPTLPEPTGTTD